MKCSVCMGEFPLGEARQFEGQAVCEACYVERATAPRPCDTLGTRHLNMHRAVTIPEED